MPASLSSWVTRFGFGKPTGIDYPGESQGLVLPLDKWSGSTIGTVPIGRGHRRDAAADGVCVRHDRQRRRPPRSPSRPRRSGAGKAARRAQSGSSSKSTADRMMLDVPVTLVLEGTGTQAAIPGYTVAGKYLRNRPEGREWPLRLQVRRLLRRARAGEEAPPRDSRDGGRAPRRHLRGVVATLAFRDIARFDLQYLEVPPDAPETRASLTATARSGG